jgi:hypothetical protein
MKASKAPHSFRERYRTLVSVLIIPLGLIIIVRAALWGWQAWTVMLMGLAFVVLGCVRLRAYLQQR